MSTAAADGVPAEAGASETVLIDRRSDGVALVTLNRPESLNALNYAIGHALIAALADLGADAAVRCVALTGAGRAFCAGGDVKSMRERSRAEGTGADGVFRIERAAAGMQRRQLGASGALHRMAKPTVALVNGHAVGAGMSLALACDLRLCSEKAKFAMAFRNVGLSGDYGGTYFLPRIVGEGLAREIFFTGATIEAERAREIGLANQVYAHDDFMTQALDFCSRLAQGPTLALGRMKGNLNRSSAAATMEEVFELEAFNTRFSGADADHRDAVQAFNEGQKPVFRGR